MNEQDEMVVRSTIYDVRIKIEGILACSGLYLTPQQSIALKRALLELESFRVDL